MKKIIIPVLLFVVTMSSCSKNDVTDEVVTSLTEDLVTINVTAGLTKGKDVTTSTLENSESGVLLHVVDSGTGDEVTNGAYKFTASGSDWSQETPGSLTWGDIQFPSYFYSMHDGTAQSLSISTGVATLDYSVEGESSGHNDLVYHASMLSSAPSGGVINVYHKHVLSKINLYAGTGTNKVYIAKVDLVNVDQDGKASITESGASWENGGQTDATYVYYSVGKLSPTMLQSSVSDGVTTNPLINPDTTAALMIIPQSTTAATSAQIESADGVSKINNSYIEVIYYMTDNNNNPVVGYSAVSKMDNASDYIDTDLDKVLYVKAAFPLKYEFVLNKQFNVTLGLGMTGSSGGILVTDYYVDETGEKVELTKKDGTGDVNPTVPEIDPGDDILPGSDDDLDIIVTVEAWPDATETTVN